MPYILFRRYALQNDTTSDPILAYEVYIYFLSPTENLMIKFHDLAFLKTCSTILEVNYQINDVFLSRMHYAEHEILQPTLDSYM